MVGFTAGCWPQNGPLPQMGDGSAGYTLNHDFVCQNDMDCQEKYGVFGACGPGDTACFAEQGLAADYVPLFYGVCVDGQCRTTCVPESALDQGFGFEQDGTTRACPTAGKFCMPTNANDKWCAQTVRSFRCGVSGAGQAICVPDAVAADYRIDAPKTCSNDTDCQEQRGLWASCAPSDAACLARQGRPAGFVPEVWGRCVDGTCRLRCFDDAELAAQRGFQQGTSYRKCPQSGPFCIRTAQYNPICSDTTQSFTCVTPANGAPACVPQ